MSINKSYAVFGLGRYGRAVAKELVQSGASVIAVDRSRKITDELVGEIPVCKCADVSEPEVIKQLGISNVDAVIIAIAENFEASLMATILCKEAGVENVIVKCSNEIHGEILKKTGADMVVLPEHESGVRLAKNIISSGFSDLVDISDNISVIELDVLPKWIGKTLAELELRKKYAINVIALKRNGAAEVAFDPEVVLEKGTKLVLAADKNVIAKLRG